MSMDVDDPFTFFSKIEQKTISFEPNNADIAFTFAPINKSNPTRKEVDAYEKDIIKHVEEHSKHNDGTDLELQVIGINGKWGFGRVRPFISDNPSVGNPSEQSKKKAKKLDNLVIRYMNGMKDTTTGSWNVVRYFLPDRFVIKLVPSLSMQSFLGKHQLESLYTISEQRKIHVIKIGGTGQSSGKDYFDTIAPYNNTTGIEYAEPYEVGFNIALWEPKDKHYYSDRWQWGLRNTGAMTGSTSGADMKVYASWNTSWNGNLVYNLNVADYESYGNYGDPDVVVALIDSGVYTSHQDFDDLYGANDAIEFGNHNYTGVGSASDLSDISSDGHGTHLAGIIGARKVHNSGDSTVKKVTGVVPLCKVMPLKIDTAATNFSTQAEAAINRVTELAGNGTGPRRYIICIPWQSSNSAIGAALDDAYDNHNILVICAAGNSGGTAPVYPARRSKCIPAGAFSNNNQKWSYSNSGANNAGWPVVFAPGTTIWSTVEGGSPWLPQEGTSCSAAFLAGAAAMLWSRDKRLNGGNFTRTNADIKDMIINPANLDPLTDPAFQRLNLRDAVNDITSPAAPS